MRSIFSFYERSTHQTRHRFHKGEQFVTTSVKHSSPLLALIDAQWLVAYCNDAFREGFHIQPGQMLPQEIKGLLRMKIKGTRFLPRTQSITFEYCIPSSTGKHFRMSLNHVHGSNMDQTETWLLQATPANNSHNGQAPPPQFEKLSPREREICLFVREGWEDTRMASQLCISPHTVNQHCKNIHNKLGTHSRPELVSLLNRIHEHTFSKSKHSPDGLSS